MDLRDFILHIVAIVIGVLIALTIAGLYVKSKLSAATSGNSTIGTLLSLFGSNPGTSGGS